jgi:anti-anti-sigma factor
MSIKHVTNGTEIACTFEGRMDTIGCTEIDEQVIALLAEAERIGEDASIIFDIASVDYVASSFLRICGRAAKAVKPGKFAMRNVQPAVKKVFKIAGLDRVLNVE